MDKKQEFSHEFKRLKSKSKLAGAYTDLLEKCLNLLEGMKKAYGEISESEEIYNEGKEFCKALIEDHPKFIIIDEYKKRFQSLNGYHESKSSIKSILEEKITLVESAFEPKTDYVPEKPIEIVKKEKHKKKKQKKKEDLDSQEEIPIQYSTNERVELLNKLRDGYEDNNYKIRRKDLKKIYGPKIKSPEGLIEVLEEVYNSKLNISTDPVFIRVDELFNDNMESYHISLDKENSDKKYEEVMSRYHTLMEKIDLIGTGIEIFRRLKEKENELDAPVGEKLDDIEPDDFELRSLE